MTIDEGISNTMTLDEFNVRVKTPSVVASIEAGSCDAVLIECYQAWAREEISLTEDVLTAVIARIWKLSQER